MSKKTTGRWFEGYKVPLIKDYVKFEWLIGSTHQGEGICWIVNCVGIKNCCDCLFNANTRDIEQLRRYVETKEYLTEKL